MRQVGQFSDVIAPELAVPGIFTLSNSRTALQNLTNTPFTEKRIDSSPDQFPLHSSRIGSFNEFRTGSIRR